MKSKKLAMLLVIVGIIAALAACGKDDKLNNSDVTASAATSQSTTAPSYTSKPAVTTTQSTTSPSYTAEPSTTRAVFEKKLLAEPLTESGNEIPSDIPTAETLLYYAKGLSFTEAFNDKSQRTVAYSFDGQTDDIKALKSYVEMLRDNGFELVDSYTNSYNNEFYSYALDYTGRTLVGKTDMNFTDGVKGDITLYFYTERGNLEGAIFYSEEIELKDYGMRYGQDREDMSYAGESAKAGLYRQGNSFETDDGRLKTELGRISVLSDGTFYSAEALVKKYDDENITIFSTGTYNRTDGIGFVLPNYAIQSGEMYANEQIDSSEACFRLMSDYQHADLMDALSSVNWQLAIGFGHGGSYICPCETIDTGIEKVFLRVMYSDDSVAVCYVAAEFDTAPYKVEALAAFDLTKSIDDNSSSSGGDSGSVGSLTTLFGTSDKCGVCNGSGKVSCLRCYSGKIDCQECGGDGWVNISLDGETLCPKCRGAQRVDCPFCRGSGEKMCSVCGGDGKR